MPTTCAAFLPRIRNKPTCSSAAEIMTAYVGRDDRLGRPGRHVRRVSDDDSSDVLEGKHGLARPGKGVGDLIAVKVAPGHCAHNSPYSDDIRTPCPQVQTRRPNVL